MYGDLDMNLAKTNEAQGVNVSDGGGACVVVMRGHAFEEFPCKFTYKGLHSAKVLIFKNKSSDGREKRGDDDRLKNEELQLPRCG